jgi:PAS domain S-box-containing protein
VALRDETQRRRTIAVRAAAIVATLLVIAIAWHVASLRSTTLAATQRRFVAVATMSARVVDGWIADRDDDLSALAEVAGIHGTDSTRIAPAIAGRILRLEMESLLRRGSYLAVWITNEHGHPLGSVGGQPLSAAEDSAIALAITTRKRVVSRPEQKDSTVTIGIVKPIVVDTGALAHVEAAVVFRSDLSHAFIPTVTATARTPTSVIPVIVVPLDTSVAGLTLCPAPSTSVCLAPTVDALARRALSSNESYGRIRTPGHQWIVATHRAQKLPWSVYYASDEDTQFAAMRERLRFEGLALLGVLVLAGLAGYAYDRSAHARRLTERAQTEARFSAIVNTAMDAIIIVDAKYAITVVNRAAELMFGRAALEATGLSVLELIPRESAGELRHALEQTLHGSGQPRLLSADRYAAGRRRDGSTFPIDLSISRTQIDGRPHLTIVIRDVTDSKRAEDGSERQRHVLEAIATGVELNAVLTSIARFQETQCPGVECAIHLLDDDGVTLRSAAAPSVPASFMEAMDEIVVGPQSATGGAAVYRREQVITPDIATDSIWNDYRSLALESGYHACWATPIRSPQGRMLGAIVVYAPEQRPPTSIELRVTGTATQLAGIAVDRAYAAESLRQSEASFRSFVENSPIGIYRATGAGRLLAVNASLVQLLGYDSALELLQVDMTRAVFVSTADRERSLRQLEAHGELRSAEMDWRRKDGSVVAVRISARAYRDDRGAVWFSEGFVENVTPLRVAELALRQSEKLAALGQLVSGVAHELNNPLAAILHFAEDLLNDERSAADLEALSVIRDQARRSRTIVRDLLSFVRFRDAARERVSLTEALGASVKALQPTVHESGGRLVSSLPEAEIFGNTDRAGLQQIVTNLVLNAAQASGRGGVVTVRAVVTEQELAIVIEDTGPGIPPALMDRIFEPFFTTKPLGEGTGLGLSVTLGIVQQLGGRITVENRTSDEGTTGARFTVTLPIDGVAVASPIAGDRRAMMAPSPIEHKSGTAPRPRALIIDDEPSIRAALRRFFTRRGWQVDEAADGAEGLGLLLTAKSDFAVVISDLKMPGCSGVELHDHIAAVAPELLDRIIFSTGDVASKDAAEFVRRTRCTVLQKPFELRALEGIVSRMRQLSTV